MLQALWSPCCAPLLLLVGLSACADTHSPASEAPDAAAIRLAIEGELRQGIEATKVEDIDAYMAQMPDDLVIYDESGEVISREQQRANVLRDWAIIDSTLYIEMLVDSLHAHSDSAATVWTSQRWERLMQQRDGVTLDTVLTTQRHREAWRLTTQGWRGYEVMELGGRVWINGEPYEG